jgi:hypothetical protein
MKKVKFIFSKLVWFFTQKKLVVTKRVIQEPAQDKMVFAIKVENRSKKKVENISILDFKQLFDNKNHTETGDYVIGNVVLSSVIANVTYLDVLAYLMKYDFMVGKIKCVSANYPLNTRILQDFKIIKHDIFGNSIEVAITPKYDPYQFQSSIIEVEENFTISDFTRIYFTEIKPNASVIYYFVEADETNLKFKK